MKIEDKVEVTLSKGDVEEILKKHLIGMGIKVSSMTFNTKTVNDGSHYGSEEFNEIKIVGKRA